MAIQNRTTTITGVFAQDAATTIPTPPVAGTSYRDTSLTTAEVNEGWPFKEIVDSSKFNQALFEYSTITKLQETYGFLPWSDLTDYDTGSYCLGTDGQLYKAKQASGPLTAAHDPVSDTTQTYWQPAPMNYNLITTAASGTISLIPNRVYKSALTGNTTFSLPSPYTGMENQIKIYLSITGSITINYGTTNFFYSESPVLEAGNYILYYDYDWNLNGWVCGYLPLGAVV